MRGRRNLLIAGGVAVVLVVVTVLVLVLQPRQETGGAMASDFASAQVINLTSYDAGSTVRVTAGGRYLISGKLERGQIEVDADDADEVQLCLNGIDLTNPTGSAIYVRNAARTTITLNGDTVNNVTDGAAYTDLDSQGEPSAAIFSHDDLAIDGAGMLIVRGNYDNAVEARDKLEIRGGWLDVEAVHHGLLGNDAVTIEGATIAVVARKDAIHSNGDVRIIGGEITIDADDDAIHADKTLTIDGGVVNIRKSEEGLEAMNVTINGGVVTVNAADDGINGAGTASGASGGVGMSGSVLITGGEIFVAGATGGGDGIDANGSVAIYGGDVVLKVPDTERHYNAIDYDTDLVIGGGRVRELNLDGTYVEIGYRSIHR